MEVETTSAFIYRLSLFAKDLGCHMKTWELQALLFALTSLTHCCVALLIRPRLLQYLSEVSLEFGFQSCLLNSLFRYRMVGLAAWFGHVVRQGGLAAADMREEKVLKS